MPENEEDALEYVYIYDIIKHFHFGFFSWPVLLVCPSSLNGTVLGLFLFILLN